MRKLGMIERTGLRRRLRALVAVVAGLVAIAGPAVPAGADPATCTV